ncbi:MAG: hypothetical protein DIU67_009165 [Actinomycetes bacterium]|jgi:hypothetical protein|nr:MAG: hypothetical protein DIU67_02780 [Actinomycetota bacterium]
MSFRLRALAAVLASALLLAACGGSAEPTTTTAAPTTTTTEPPVFQVAYSLAEGQEYVYEVAMDQTIEMRTSGDPAALEEEDLPGEMQMRVKGPIRITYEVGEGPEPDTFEITISADLEGLEFEATVDGKAASQDELPGFAGLDVSPATIVVDRQGRVVQPGVGAGEDLFGGVFQGLDLDSMSDLGNGGLNPIQFFGAILPTDGISPGDTWSYTQRLPLFGDDEATIETANTFDRVEQLDGREVMVIDTVVSTSAIRIDFADFLLAFFEAFIPEGEATEEDLAALEELRNSLRFVFDVDASETRMTTWFDPEAGVTRRFTVEGDGRVKMDINVPNDEETGQMVSFTLDMSSTQTLAYRLVEGPEA